MTDGADNNGGSVKPATPAFKKFAGAKLVPLPTPIAQSNDKETFPVFLGVGIALALVALVTVCILSCISPKSKTQAPASPTPNAAPASSSYH